MLVIGEHQRVKLHHSSEAYRRGIMSICAPMISNCFRLFGSPGTSTGLIRKGMGRSGDSGSSGSHIQPS